MAAIMPLSVSHSIQCESKKIPLRFSGIFPKRLGIFSPNFTRLLYVPIYTRLQIFIQLSATLTSLCHIKRDHPVHIICSMSIIGWNARVQMFAKVLVALLIVVCSKSSQNCCSALFSSGMVFGFDWSLWNAWSIAPHTWGLGGVGWVRSGEFGGHWSFAQFVIVGYFTHS